jgi:hypothetical protein
LVDPKISELPTPNKELYIEWDVVVVQPAEAVALSSMEFLPAAKAMVHAVPGGVTSSMFSIG